MSFDIIPNASKDDVVAELSSKCSERELVGDILWGIKEDILPTGDEGNTIICYSLGYDELGWGYKEIPEYMAPSYYTCPLRFLDLATVTCKPWRDRVRKHHEQQTKTHL
jgi:hypothetical protein